VTVAGVPQAGVRVTAEQPSGGDSFSKSSDVNGQYAFGLVTGSWTVGIAPIEGADCPGESDVSVDPDQTSTKDFACTPRTGLMVGVVTLDGVPVPGVTVQIVDQVSGDVTSVVTDGEGLYLASLVSSRYAAFVTIDNATCEGIPRTVDVVAPETLISNVVCQTILGTIRGEVTLDGAPAAGVPVDIIGEDASGQSVVLASVLTDAGGRYVATVTPGERFAVADIEGTVCSREEQVTVVSGQEAVADLACFAIEGLYDATFTETSNTCGLPLTPPFDVPLEVGYRTTGGQAFVDIRPGDRPEETTASGPYDPETGAVTAESPTWVDSGITFQEFWAFEIGLSGVSGPAFDGTIEVRLSVGEASCHKTIDLAATRTGN
jgi:hypothetical protein